jgi:DNA helicase-2/ATP-dependent DNA helicase PcrA
MSLNPSQTRVSLTRGPRTLALAGAGTGKTTTCVHWVVNLIEEGTPASEILMLTFTKKAAWEMKTRIENLLAEKHNWERNVTIGNYHSIATQYIRRHPEAFGLIANTFTILDDDDNEKLWKTALKELGLKKQEWKVEELSSLISKAVNWCLDPIEVLKENFPLPENPQFTNRQAIAIQLYQKYLEIKKGNNAINFDDILVLFLQRLQRDGNWRENLRNKYRNVLVDELQDNNSLNAAILTELNPHRIIGVGDAAQSIYGFRNANPHLIEDFKNEPGTETLTLEDNYRSGQVILDLANEVIAGTPTALTLKAARHFPGSVRFETYPNDRNEALGITNWILAERRTCPPSEIAILARSSSAWRNLEIELRRRNIKYKTYGGISIVDRSEVKDLASFLRVHFNPNDQTAWVRASTLFQDFGEAGAMKFFKKHGNRINPTAPDWPEQLIEFQQILLRLQRCELLQEMVSFLISQIKPLFLLNYKDDYEERIQTLQTLLGTITEQEMTLVEFLDTFTTEKGEVKQPEDAIVLSTIHSAKGLEWKKVWIMGMGSTQIPHSRTKTPGERLEEQRLTYVAITRAKDQLVCSYPEIVWNKYQGACPFLETRFNPEK